VLLICQQFVYSEANEECIHIVYITEIKYLELQKKWLIFTLKINFIWEILIKPLLYFSFPFLVKLQIWSFLDVWHEFNL
jgi:hypothetical protein